MKTQEHNKNLLTQLEALLFISPRPLSVKKLTELTGGKTEEIAIALDELAQYYDNKERGIRLQRRGDEAQIVTAPVVAKLVNEFLKAEAVSELTRPQLETLTILAYRGPMTKAELEHIRGVNVSLIIRNLELRGLIEGIAATPYGPRYQVTFDFLQHLGIASQQELPQFSELANDPLIDSLLAGTVETPPVPSS